MKKQILLGFLALISIAATNCLSSCRVAAQTKANHKKGDSQQLTWKPIVYAFYDRETHAVWLNVKTNQLEEGVRIPKFTFLSVWYYEADKQKWIKLPLKIKQPVIVKPGKHQIYSQNTDQRLVRLSAKAGLYWAEWKEDDHVIDALAFAGMLCNDVNLGEPPNGMIATCVPSVNRATAMFVPDPKIHCRD